MVFYLFRLVDYVDFVDFVDFCLLGRLLLVYCLYHVSRCNRVDPYERSYG